MKPRNSSRPPSKTVPTGGTRRGGGYQYAGAKTSPQPGEKPKN